MRLIQGLMRLLPCACCLLLASCGIGGIDEVKVWMVEVKRDMHTALAKVNEPKVFVPVDYTGKDQLDPFSQGKLQVAFNRARSDNDKMRPDMERRKEALENFPLDTMTMVGTVEKPSAKMALIQVDKSVYQVKVGNYMGQNFGMVTKISDSTVELKETVQDASGDWVQRTAKLELQEAKK